MTALDVLQHLHDAGIILTPRPDGALHYKAPKGRLIPELLEEMHQHKDVLHGLMEVFEERAAIAEYCAGLTREEAERLAWACVCTPHTGCAACGYPDTTQNVG